MGCLVESETYDELMGWRVYVILVCRAPIHHCHIGHRLHGRRRVIVKRGRVRGSDEEKFGHIVLGKMW